MCEVVMVNGARLYIADAEEAEMPTQARQSKADGARAGAKARTEEARAGLREVAQPGDVLYTVLRHVSRSGMYRVVDVYSMQDQQEAGVQPVRITGWVADALGWKYDKKHEGIGVSGCGMDVGFEVVYNLGRVLYPLGVPCTGVQYGKGACGSNEHSNPGDRGYVAGKGHTDGGYAFKHKWL